MSPTTLTAPPATAQRLAPDDDAFVVVTHQGTRVAEIRAWRTSLISAATMSPSVRTDPRRL